MRSSIFFALFALFIIFHSAAHADTINASEELTTIRDGIEPAGDPSNDIPLDRKGIVRGGLFSASAVRGEVGAAGDPTIVRARFVTPDFDLPGRAENPSNTVTLNLFDDALFTAVIDRVEPGSPGDFTWVGHLEGVEHSLVTLVIRPGLMAGNIALPGAFYQVRYAGNGVHAIREIDQSVFPPEMEPIPVDIPHGDPSGPPSGLRDDCSSIDVLVVYSTNARTAEGGTAAMEALIDLAVAETNQSYINSGATQRLTLVHTAEVTDAADDFYTDLGRLRDPADSFMDEVHSLRDAYTADMVALIIESYSYCGLAYLMDPVSSSFAPWAFSVVARTCATGYYSFAHELGHNMGARHDWFVDDAVTPYTSAHGYVNATDLWRTIMAYYDHCDCTDEVSPCPAYASRATPGSPYCPRLQYWSSPDVSYGGDPMGVPASTSTACTEGDIFNPDCDADNSLTLDDTCSIVANFRVPRFGVINEILYDPADDEASGEWVEIYVTSGGFDLGGYILSDQDGYSVTFPSFTPEAGEYIIVANGVGDDDLVGPVYVVHRGSGSAMWNNAGDDALLETAGHECVDYMAYGSGGAIQGPPAGCVWGGAPNPSSGSEGVSISLVVDGYDTDYVSDWAASGSGGTTGPHSRGADNNEGLTWASDVITAASGSGSCPACVPALASSYPRYTLNDPDPNLYEDYVTIRSTSASGLQMPIRAVLKTMTPEDVFADNPDGGGSDPPTAYWEYSLSSHDGTTSADDILGLAEEITRIWRFAEEGGAAFSFWAEVYATGAKGDRWLGQLGFSPFSRARDAMAKEDSEDSVLDDGTVEIHAGSTTGALVLANRFAAISPVSLRSVSFYTSGWSAGDQAEVIVFDDPTGAAPGPDPSMEVWRTPVVLGGGGFQEVPADGLKLNPGGIPGAAFFVAVANRAERSYTLGIDMSGPYAGASTLSTDGGLTFEPLSGMPIIDGNVMIRVYVEQVETCFIGVAK